MSDKDKRYRFLFILTIATAIGFQGWRTLLNNFAVNIANIQGNQMGMIQSIREIPGFLALLVVFLLYLVKEEVLALISLSLLGLGVGLTGLFPNYYGLIFTTLIMSVGFHYYETVNQSLTLQYFDKKESPVIMAKFKSVGAIVNISVGVAIYVLMKFFNYKSVFVILGMVVISLILYSSFKIPDKKNLPVQRKKMILRKKYSLFYLLTFLAGARRQVFVVFSVFLMVKKFNLSIYEITFLFVLNNLINMVFMPFVGKAINKFGEKKILSVEYILIIPVFLIYAYCQNKYIIMAVYVVDHLVFNFSIAIRSFFQKIADPKDIAPSMAVSFTINHVAAVFIPALGGALWIVDYKIPFIAGVFIAVLSLIATQKIQIKPSIS